MDNNGKKEGQGYPMRRERSFHANPSRAAAANLAALRRERSFANPAPPFHVGGRDPRRRSAMPALRGKPAMELYRPPKRGNAHETNLNVNAKEFQPGLANGNGDSTGKHLQRSRSTKDARTLKGSSDVVPGHLMRSKSSKDGRMFKVTFSAGGAGDGLAPSDDLTNYDKRNGGPQMSPVGGGALKRSRSMGAELLAGQRSHLANGTAAGTQICAELGHFGPDVQTLLHQAQEDPNRLSGRHMMELVRHVFNRLVESARYGEPTARLCLAIVERERTETFLETLLNTCQEWYQQRDRLLRQHQQTTYSGGFVPGSPRWIAYMTFVNELYTLLKRRLVGGRTSRSVGSAVQMLLELLAECCQVTLRAPGSVNSLAETECVFLIMTSIGRDLETEAAGQLERVMSAVRDAIINYTLITTVSKTLLQLIELQAARWQLPAPTVMYYYPMSAK